MNRKLFSLAGSLIAVIGLTVNASSVDAGGRHGNRVNRPQCCGDDQRPGFDGISHGRQWGDGGLYGGRPQPTGGPPAQPYYYYTGTPLSYPGQPYYLTPSPVSSVPMPAPTPAVPATPTPVSTPTPTPAPTK